MTAALTIPAAVAEHRVDGVPFVAAIVESDYCERHCECPRCEPGAKDRCQWCGPDGYGPPADLVALRDARCWWCHGRPAKRHLCPNDRCVDGRLLHDVRVECETPICSGCHRPRTNWDSECKCSYTSFGIPPVQSYRTVRCLVDVVKVRRDYTDHGSPAVVVMCEPMVSAGRVFWVAADGSSSVALDPTHVDALGGIDKFVPGKSFALVATVVER